MYRITGDGGLVSLAVESGKASIVLPLVKTSSIKKVETAWSAAVMHQTLGIAGQWEAIKQALSKKDGFKPPAPIVDDIPAGSEAYTPPTPVSLPRAPAQQKKSVLHPSISSANTPNTPTLSPSQKQKKQKRRNKNVASPIAAGPKQAWGLGPGN